MAEYGTMRVKSGLAEMLKGGVIMDVTNVDQAKIAEEAGAVSVMALERIPAEIRAHGGDRDWSGLTHTYIVLDPRGNCYANIPGTEEGATR